MARICEGRVVVVTGAGRGIGRSHALEFARQGAKVVVNDLGAEVDGTGGSSGPTGEVVDEIRSLGGEAVANGDDVSDAAGAQRIIAAAVDTFGGLDVLVNNAGILRDRMLVNLAEDDWDAVIRVHLKGTYLMSHHAANYWRQRTKDGLENDARIINTSSPSGLTGNVGQSNYGAAKAAIAGFSLIIAAELARYGVTVNAVSPSARTRMTQGGQMDKVTVGEGEWDPYGPDNIAPLVVWLGSRESAGITGRVFGVAGGRVAVLEGWSDGPSVDKGRQWTTDEVGAELPGLVADSVPPRVLGGRPHQSKVLQAGSAGQPRA
jgi:NAD(P)-dependent dehydrogenase (short-subunit alcohol dehydrogenase family)